MYRGDRESFSSNCKQFFPTIGVSKLESLKVMSLLVEKNNETYLVKTLCSISQVNEMSRSMCIFYNHFILIVNGFTMFCGMSSSLLLYQKLLRIPVYLVVS